VAVNSGTNTGGSLAIQTRQIFSLIPSDSSFILISDMVKKFVILLFTKNESHRARDFRGEELELLPIWKNKYNFLPFRIKDELQLDYVRKPIKNFNLRLKFYPAQDPR
jgi:hypothetical protein